MNTAEPLSGVLREIAEAAGEPAALAVARARGGTEVYFPAVPADDHWLCELLGHEAARAVCERLTCGIGSIRISLPIGPARRAAAVQAQVDSMLAENCSELQIWRATGYTIRAIRWRRARMKNNRQLSLL